MNTSLSRPLTDTPDTTDPALRALAYSGIAILGLVVAWGLMPYPENGCPDESGTTCEIPSPRQWRWLTLVPSVLVLGVLAIDVRRCRSRGRIIATVVVPAVAGAVVILLAYRLLMAAG